MAAARPAKKKDSGVKKQSSGEPADRRAPAGRKNAHAVNV